MIDPFTGEGIGNALVSGKLSAAYPIIDHQTGVAYQKQLWDTIGEELLNSHRFQRMLKYKWLMNWFFRRANKKPALRDAITDMLHNKESQGKLGKLFLLRHLLLPW